jgi:hypothetical protein
MFWCASCSMISSEPNIVKQVGKNAYIFKFRKSITVFRHPNQFSYPMSQSVDYYAPVIHKAKSKSLISSFSGLYNQHCFFRHISVSSPNTTQHTTPAPITLFIAISSTVEEKSRSRTLRRISEER